MAAGVGSAVHRYPDRVSESRTAGIIWHAQPPGGYIRAPSPECARICTSTPSGSTSLLRRSGEQSWRARQRE